MYIREMRINVIYDEFYTTSYKRVEVEYCGTIIQFLSEDVVKDFRNAKQFTHNCYNNAKLFGKVDLVILGNSVDMFIQDNNEYKWTKDCFIAHR
jgi:hypothetical protein